VEFYITYQIKPMCSFKYRNCTVLFWIWN